MSAAQISHLGSDCSTAQASIWIPNTMLLLPPRTWSPPGVQSLVSFISLTIITSSRISPTVYYHPLIGVFQITSSIPVFGVLLYFSSCLLNTFSWVCHYHLNSTFSRVQLSFLQVLTELTVLLDLYIDIPYALPFHVLSVTRFCPFSSMLSFPSLTITFQVQDFKSSLNSMLTNFSLSLQSSLFFSFLLSPAPCYHFYNVAPYYIIYLSMSPLWKLNWSDQIRPIFWAYIGLNCQYALDCALPFPWNTPPNPFPHPGTSYQSFMV